jgi:hypothetical protein
MRNKNWTLFILILGVTGINAVHATDGGPPPMSAALKAAFEACQSQGKPGDAAFEACMSSKGFTKPSGNPKPPAQ